MPASLAHSSFLRVRTRAIVLFRSIDFFLMQVCEIACAREHAGTLRRTLQYGPLSATWSSIAECSRKKPGPERADEPPALDPVVAQ